MAIQDVVREILQNSSAIVSSQRDDGPSIPSSKIFGQGGNSGYKMMMASFG
jgi:hypothetical protein